MSEKELNSYRLTSLEESKDEMLSAIIHENAEETAEKALCLLRDYFDSNMHHDIKCDKRIYGRCWLPEMHSVNITIGLDGFLEDIKSAEGDIFLVTKEGDLCCIYPTLISMQSSGMTYKDDVVVNERYVAVWLQLSPDACRKELHIPNIPFKREPFHNIPNNYDKFTLNISVCGEFNLYAFYYDRKNNTLYPLFYDMFCCK